VAEREELILEIQTQLADAQQQVADLQSQLEELTADNVVEVRAEVEGKDDVDELAETVDDLDGTSATVEVDADDQASDVVDRVGDELDALDGSDATVSVQADDEASDTLGDIADQVDDLDGQDASVTVSVEGAEDANSELEDIIGNLQVLAAGALTAGAAAGLGSVFSAAAENVLDIQTLAEATGDTLENASGIVEQFDFIGVGAERLLTFIGRVNDTMGESPDIAARLGVTIGANQSPLETFVATVDALNSGQLGANERLELAVELFGRRGANAVLQIGSQIGDLGQAIEDIPEWQVVTDQDIDAAIAFKEQVDAIGDQIAEAGQRALVTLGPALVDILGVAADIADTVNTIGEFGLGGEEIRRSVFDWMESFPSEKFVEINDSYLELGGTVESLRDNFFHLNEVRALLDVGVPPEIIAQAKLTEQALAFLGETMADSAETAAALAEAFDAAQVSGEEWRQITADGVITMAEVKAAINDTTGALDEQGEAIAGAATSIDDINSALEQYNETQSLTDVLTGGLIRNMQAGTTETQNFKDAWNQLKEILQLTDDEMAEFLQQKLDEKLDADAKAALAAEQAMIELGAALSGVIDDMNTAAARADAFAAALEQIESVDPPEVTAAIETQQAITDLEDLVGAFTAWRDELGKTDFSNVDVVPDSWSEIQALPDDLPPVLEAIAGFRETIQSEMAQAFERDGPAGLRDWSDSMRTAVTQSLSEVEGITQDQINQVLSALGLLPEDVEVLIQVSVDQQKINVIQDVVAALDNIPPNVAASISLAINNQQPDVALQILNSHLVSIGEEPITLTVNADTGEFDLQMEGVTAPKQVPVSPEPQGWREADREFDDVARDRDTKITADSNAEKMKEDLDTAAVDRPTTITANLTQQIIQGLLLSAFLDFVARTRETQFLAKSDNLGAVNDLLNLAARTRDVQFNIVGLPTAADIAARIGVVRVPIDAYIRNVPRIDGSRYVV
jgi:hypothetical protein